MNNRFWVQSYGKKLILLQYETIQKLSETIQIQNYYIPLHQNSLAYVHTKRGLDSHARPRGY